MKQKICLKQLEEMLQLFNDLLKQADSESTKKALEMAILKTKAEIHNVRLEELSND